MERKLLVTKDGSHTVVIENKQVTYHSMHGAIAESQQVFIEAGLRSLKPDDKQVSIFEMGFGTGLNALLTILESQKTHQNIYYHATELYPLEDLIWRELNFPTELMEENADLLFNQIHLCEWNINCQVANNFTLHKSRSNLITLTYNRRYDVIYFDAFAPSAQPELWTEEIFRKMFEILKSGGILVTYCSKGSVRRAMQAVGFVVEKLPGPPGKREIVRAVKVRSS
jgi:tRNA U34 5-methylaminomethyl-2-thiouridine-forming methyltransferase MnmC